MSDYYVIQTETLTHIADSIRAKFAAGDASHRDTATMTPQQMPTLIGQIESGGIGYGDIAYRSYIAGDAVIEQYDCDGVPTNVTYIAKYAFYSTKITSVSAPYVTQISEYAFQFCRALTYIDMPLYEGSTGASNVFYNCSALPDLYLPALRYAGPNFCQGCTSLEIIDLPACESLASSSFRECTALVSVNLPACRDIAAFAFYKPAFTELWLPALVTTASSAIANALNLTTVKIGASSGTSGMSLNSRTFSNCNALTDIYVAWAEGEVANAPWGATRATVHYNTQFDADGNVIS